MEWVSFRREQTLQPSAGSFFETAMRTATLSWSTTWAAKWSRIDGGELQGQSNEISSQNQATAPRRTVLIATVTVFHDHDEEAAGDGRAAAQSAGMINETHQRPCRHAE